MALYQGLSHKPVTFQHLEEFLVALGQKEPVMLSAEQPEKTVLTVDQPRKETLYLYKNTWGYVRMEIEVQETFWKWKRKSSLQKISSEASTVWNTLSIRRKSETAAITAELRCVRKTGASL